MTNPLLQGDVIAYTCEVAYRGGLEPQMVWFDPHGLADSVIDESIPGERLKKSVIVLARVKSNGWTHKCHIYFNGPQDPGEHYATNAPSYEYIYRSPALDIQCRLSISFLPDLIDTKS